MRKEVYLKDLGRLKKAMDNSANTPFTMYAKVITLVVMNIRYEKVAFNSKLDIHPYLLAKDIITKAVEQFDSMLDAAFINNKDKKIIGTKSRKREEKHRVLFNEIWDRYGHKDYIEYVERYVRRIKVNKLEKAIKGKKCIDLGCGNGNFCIAL